MPPGPPCLGVLPQTTASWVPPRKVLCNTLTLHLPLSGRNGFNFSTLGSKLPLSVQKTDKMCPGRPRMAVNIIGCTLIGYFSLSGAFALNWCWLIRQDYTSFNSYCYTCKRFPAVHQLHGFSNIDSCYGGV